MIEEKTTTEEYIIYGALGLLVGLTEKARESESVYLKAAMRCVKKQIPQLVKNLETDASGITSGDCPECGCGVFQETNVHCPDCGQKLRWYE